MNSYLKSLLVLFAFFVIGEWVTQNLLLPERNYVNPEFWRAPDLSSRLFWVSIIGNGFLAFIVCAVFARADSSTLIDRIIYGVLIGAMVCSVYTVQFAVAAISLQSLIVLCSITMVKFVAAGLLFYWLNMSPSHKLK